jgi:hypothetical protein
MPWEMLYLLRTFLRTFFELGTLKSNLANELGHREFDHSLNGGGSSSSCSSSSPAAPNAKNLYKDVSEAEKEEVCRRIASYDEDPASKSTDTNANGDQA